MDDLVERVAVAIWRSDAEATSPATADRRTLEAFHNEANADVQRQCLHRSKAAIEATGIATLQAELTALRDAGDRLAGAVEAFMVAKADAYPADLVAVAEAKAAAALTAWQDTRK